MNLALLLQEPAAQAVKSAAEERLKLWGDFSLGDPWFLLAIPLGLILLAAGRARGGRDRGRVPALPAEVAVVPVRGLAGVPLFAPLAGLALALALRFALVPLLPDQGERLATARTIALVMVLLSAGLVLLLLGARWVERAVPRPRAAARSGPWSTSLAQSCAWLVPALQVVALVSLCIALARPLRGSVETLSTSEGVDIALVVDRSGSMTNKDLDPELTAGRTRLEVVKEVVRDFAVRRMSDREAAADNVALITFAAFPQLLCPFTLDVDAITGFLEQLEPVTQRWEDGTGIGIGLAKAVQVMRETEARSKVVVLLTDGENNIDQIQPADAARLAAEHGIKVYTVFAGRYIFKPDLFGNMHATEQEIDSSDLEFIAQTTGGRFFRARDKAELEQVYAEIERLERTPRQERQWSETYDLYPRFLVPALAAYALAWLLSSTLLRRIA